MREAWGVALKDEESGNATDFVIGELPTFTLKCKKRTFLVNVSQTPYFGDPDAASERVSELRLARGIGGHRAWLSVELLLGAGKKVEDYRYIGKLLAELAPDDALALMCPELALAVPYARELQSKLRGPNPLEALTSYNQVPVFKVPEDDPEMVRAVAEAKRRWPEFADAFQRRKPGDRFFVKAPFSHGIHTETMWLSVETIEGDEIQGMLDSDPVHVRLPKYGDPVAVSVNDVKDWLVVRGDQRIGAFTSEKERKRARRES